MYKINAVGTVLNRGVRRYELDRTGDAFNDVTVVLAGARINFKRAAGSCVGESAHDLSVPRSIFMGRPGVLAGF